MRQQRLSDALARLHRLRGNADQLIAQKAQLIGQIHQSQAYLDSKDEVSDCLAKLQSITQAKTRSIYEELLTKLIHEVKGYDPENHKVVLKTRMRGTRPWLDIEIENASGHSRDVYLDKGGSIKNIVAMGLRFITLSRTASRRLIAFDEADKDLNPRYVPALAQMLHRLAQQVGMQVIYISHHDPSYFQGSAKIVHLSRRAGAIVSQTIDEGPGGEVLGLDAPDAATFLDGAGIRYLRLVNIKQHSNTLVELSRFVTVITGDNDIGKSTIIQALDALSKNRGREGLIRDNQSACRVEIGLEEDVCLSFSYKRSASRKSEYQLVDRSNKIIHSSNEGSAIPQWLNAYLGMALYKDFDLQISNQDNASFILDARVSGHRRAEILSLGAEADRVSRMILMHNRAIDHHVREVNRQKKQLIELKNKLEAYRQLGVAEQMAERACGLGESTQALSDTLSRQMKVAVRLKDAQQLDRSLAPLARIQSIPRAPTTYCGAMASLLGSLQGRLRVRDALRLVARLAPPARPVLAGTGQMVPIARGLSRALSVADSLRAASEVRLPCAPVLVQTDHLIGQLQRRLAIEGSLGAIPMMRLPQTPQIGVPPIHALELRLKQATLASTENELAISQIRKQIDEAAAQYREAVNLAGGICPVCKGVLHE